MPYKDPEKKRENAKAYRLAHPEVHRKTSRQWYKTHKERVNTKARAWKLKNKSRITDLRREKMYGVSKKEFEDMFAKQNGLCAICERSMALRWGCRGNQFGACIDHDHRTGKIRELLCVRCNSCIGMFDESPSVLLKAAIYLERHAQKES